MDGRKGVKIALISRLYHRGYDRQRVISLFRFIDWLLVLPGAVEREVRVVIAQLEKEHNMPYITSVERFAAEEGRAEGRVEEARRAVLRVVRRRFGTVPAGLEDRLGDVADLTRLEALLDVTITATTMDEVWAALGAASAEQ